MGWRGGRGRQWMQARPPSCPGRRSPPAAPRGTRTPFSRASGKSQSALKTSLWSGCSFTPPRDFCMNATRPSGLANCVLAEGDDRALRPGIDLGEPALRGQPLDLHDVEQVLDLARQLAEAVDQLGGEGVDVGALLQQRQAAVEPEPQLQVGDVALRDQHRRRRARSAGSTGPAPRRGRRPSARATASSSIDW